LVGGVRKRASARHTGEDKNGRRAHSGKKHPRSRFGFTLRKYMRKKTLNELWQPLGKKAAKAATGADNPAVEAIWHVVAAIPRGRISRCGAVAGAAGLPGRARQTGYALRIAPKEMHLPWHRVLGAGGRIVFPKASREYREQAKRLKAEGVAVLQGRADGRA